MTDRFEIKAALEVSDAGDIAGLAWPFGSPDRVGDVIEKGAFSTAPVAVPMLWSHDQSQVVGVWDQIAETPEGLTVKGRLLVNDVERAREVRALIRAGAVGGLSIGFITKKATRSGRGRKITALDLHEVSIVAVPCHPGAKITSLKSVTSKDFPTMENDEPAITATTPANDAPVIDLKKFEAIQRRLDALEAKSQRPGVIGIVQADQPEKKAFATYLRIGKDAMEQVEQKALAVANNAAGGYLVPTEQGGEILKLLTEMSPLRQYANVQTVSGTEIAFPTLLSGVNAAWTDEGDDMTESEPTFGQVKIANHELSSFFVANNKALEDNAYNLEGEMNTELAKGFAKKEGAAFIKGTGIGQPRGLLTATGIAEVKTGVAANFPAANPMDMLIKLQHAIPSFHARSAVWLMNLNTLSLIRQFKDAQGQYLVTDPIDGGVLRLLGNPVVEMPDMPDVAAGATPIMFGDMSGYRVFDRIGLSILRDPFTLGTKSQVRFIARKRVGADLTHPDRFVKLKVAA